jgi:hypothetical protein
MKQWTGAAVQCCLLASVVPARAELMRILVAASHTRDGKFARPEIAGVERLVTGIAAGLDDDEARLAAAFVLFQGLYDGFKRRKS